MSSLTRASRVSRSAPAAASSAISSTIRPRPIVIERESRARTSNRSSTASAAAVADWNVADTPPDRLRLSTAS